MYILWTLIIVIILPIIIWRTISNIWYLPCPSWLSCMVEKENPFTKITSSAKIIDSLNIQYGMNILDAGCGPGRITIPIAFKVGKKGSVFALDIQEKMLEQVKQKAINSKLTNINFINTALGHGNLKKNIFDRAILVTVLGEIPNQKDAIKEIFQSLKPGGILSITETLFDPHYQTLNNVINLTQKAGFKKYKVISDIFSYNLILEKPVQK